MSVNACVSEELMKCYQASDGTVAASVVFLLSARTQLPPLTHELRATQALITNKEEKEKNKQRRRREREKMKKRKERRRSGMNVTSLDCCVF